MVGVGAAFDFISGTKPQAPHWMQRMGLEWLFRLCTEPRRLWHRYAWHNPRFVGLVAWQLACTRWRSRSRNLRSEPTTPEAETQSDWAWVGIDVQGLQRSLREKRVQLILKRVFDWAASALILLVLAPALLLIALLLRISSRGPVVFSQPRVGYREKAFVMYKFRSMRIEPDLTCAAAQQSAAAQGMLLKREDDPRVTLMGRFLRSTSLDELPQLLNVLKGDMSLVGPRPLQLRDYELLTQAGPDWQRCRFSVRPGITCLWQVNGRSSIPFEQWMELDQQYVHRWSLWLDLQILAKTIPAVLKGSGAA